MIPEQSSVAVEIREGRISLPGLLATPSRPRGMVLFAHGSGSSRLSPRNRQVAAELNSAGFQTLLFDLLTEAESFDRANVFDIELLARRLILATRWASKHAEQGLPIGYFGASTGAAAALWAASRLGKEVRAVVSRGGRPDLAISQLNHVSAPTLLIVGGDDASVIDMNERAFAQLRRGQLVIVPGATHLFEEPGALEQVSRYALDWFDRYLASEIRSSRAA